jgi:hypothetical protein
LIGNPDIPFLEKSKLISQFIGTYCSSIANGEDNEKNQQAELHSLHHLLFTACSIRLQDTDKKAHWLSLGIDRISYHHLFPSSLLKTFSVNPFQGQYPNIAVRIIATPISPSISPENPEKRKAEAIKIPATTNRKTLSPLPTFIILIANPILSSL